MGSCKYRIGDEVQFESFGRVATGIIRDTIYHSLGRGTGYWSVVVNVPGAVEDMTFNVTLFPYRLRLLHKASGSL